jgi:CubicO group peptidase (beta-lactamase class C family)
MWMKPAALLCILTLLFGPPAMAATEPVDEFVKREMHERKIPGLAVAILKDRQPFKLGTYGLANVEHLVPVTPRTLFQTASVGKQFTAAAVQLLAREGKLGLDDPVSRHIAGTPAAWENMTIRHLLSNTSGLAGYPEKFDWRRTDVERRSGIHQAGSASMSQIVQSHVFEASRLARRLPGLLDAHEGLSGFRVRHEVGAALDPG